MRNTIKAALIGAATIATLAVPAAAMASTGPNANSGQTLTKIVGQHAAVYTDPNVGPVSCTEVNHSKQGTTFDSVTCTSTTGLPLTNVTPGAPYSTPWYSDFGTGASAGHYGTFNGTVSADGMSYTGIAAY
jgi:hypothetical protein